MLFSGKEAYTIDYITIDNEKITESESTKFLGLWMDKNLNWKKHT